MAKAASITEGLFKKKGEAVPSETAVGGLRPPRTTPPHQNENTAYYKSLTLKLDRKRYEALKHAGIKDNKKSQQILVEALDLWLSARPDKNG